MSDRMPSPRRQTRRPRPRRRPPRTWSSRTPWRSASTGAPRRKRPQAAPGWTAGASSVQQIGFVELTTDEADTRKACGLELDDDDQSLGDIDFAFYLTQDKVRIRENGEPRSTPTGDPCFSTAATSNMSVAIQPKGLPLIAYSAHLYAYGLKVIDCPDLLCVRQPYEPPTTGWK